MNNHHKFNLILVILSMLTIFLFSCESGGESSNTSKNIVKEVASVVFKEDSDKIDKFDKSLDDNLFVLRKSAHLVEFYLLGFLILNLFKDYRKISKKMLFICTFLCLIYASSDELHQLFVVGRTAKILDIIIDTLGASFGIISYYLLYKSSHKSRYKNELIIDTYTN